MTTGVDKTVEPFDALFGPGSNAAPPFRVVPACGVGGSHLGVIGSAFRSALALGRMGARVELGNGWRSLCGPLSCHGDAFVGLPAGG